MISSFKGRRGSGRSRETNIDRALRSLDLDPEAVDVWTGTPNSHTWFVIPQEDGTCAVGGFDRGDFRPYRNYVNDQTAVAAALELAAPPRPRVLDEGALAALRRQSDELRARLPEGPLAISDFPVGTALDHIGSESGHVLHILDEPAAGRSLSPMDLLHERVGYFLTAPLPPGARTGRMVPWFGQPGGAPTITLDRTIAEYVQLGLLERFDTLHTTESQAAFVDGEDPTSRLEAAATHLRNNNLGEGIDFALPSTQFRPAATHVALGAHEGRYRVEVRGGSRGFFSDVAEDSARLNKALAQALYAMRDLRRGYVDRVEAIDKGR